MDLDFGGDGFEDLGDAIAGSILEHLDEAAANPEVIEALIAAQVGGAAESKSGQASADVSAPEAAVPPTEAPAVGAGAPVAVQPPALPAGKPVAVTTATLTSFDRKLTAVVQHYDGMLYVWVGGGAALPGSAAPETLSQPNLVVAHPPRALSTTTIPASSTIVFGAASLPIEAVSAAPSLATWAKQPVFLTWAVPVGTADAAVGLVDDAVAAVKAAVQEQQSKA